jgi:hypothetical protein
MLSRALKKARLSEEVRRISIRAVQENLKDSYKRYYEKKGSAHKLQQTALEDLAEAMAETGNSTQAQVLKVLRERENQRATARKIKYLQGTIRSGSTTMVTIIDQDGQRVDLTKQRDIELAILEHNNQKFTQSSGTPFYLPPLKDEFSFKGITGAAQATLAGVYESNHSLDERILEVIKQRQMPEAVRNLGPKKLALTFQEYMSYWKKAREDTACYPSELSFSTVEAGAWDFFSTDYNFIYLPDERTCR